MNKAPQGLHVAYYEALPGQSETKAHLNEFSSMSIARARRLVGLGLVGLQHADRSMYF